MVEYKCKALRKQVVELASELYYIICVKGN